MVAKVWVASVRVANVLGWQVSYRGKSPGGKCPRVASVLGWQVSYGGKSPGGKNPVANVQVATVRVANVLIPIGPE